MKSRRWIPLLILNLVAAISWGQDSDVSDLGDYQLQVADDQLRFRSVEAGSEVAIHINGQPDTLRFSGGQASLPFSTDAVGGLFLIQDSAGNRLYHIARLETGHRIRKIPLWLSIMPPLVAIFLALVFREVIVSLFAGIWMGAFIAGGLRVDSIYYLLLPLFKVVEKYIINALNDPGHLSVVIFSLLIGGMVAIISRNGGMAGVVSRLTRFARTRRSAQFITWLLGVAIFFDDYANTLIVGNTMRSVTDRFKVSREKLAYIVDSTAAPVAAVAFITTWIGAELGYIDDGVESLRRFNFDMTAYAIFLQSLKYSFYPVLTLSFILILVFTGRDYGQMLEAERRAYHTGSVKDRSLAEEGGEALEDLSPVKDAPLRAYNAVIPVLIVVCMTMYGLLDTGFSATYAELLGTGASSSGQSWGSIWADMGALLGGEEPGFFLKLGKLIGNADSYVALLWSSISGIVAALLLTLVGRIMNLDTTMGALVAGFKTMLPALIILTLAWSLAITTEELHTALYLTSTLEGSINPYFMPAIIFVLSAAIAFSTGSSWSTMAILYPIAIPTTWAICRAAGIDPAISLEIMLNVIATVLAASVMGDHCSPISDTTILSSLASDCNHIDHVRTQLPYALTVGSVSLVAGTLSTLLGGGWAISLAMLLASLLLLVGICLRFGKQAYATTETAENRG